MFDARLFREDTALQELVNSMAQQLRTTPRPATQPQEAWGAAFLATLVAQAEAKVAEERADYERRLAEAKARECYQLVNHSLGLRVDVKPAEVDDFAKAYALRRKDLDKLFAGEVPHVDNWRRDELSRPGQLCRAHIPPKRPTNPYPLGGTEDTNRPEPPAMFGTDESHKPVPPMRSVNWKQAAEEAKKGK